MVRKQRGGGSERPARTRRAQPVIAAALAACLACLGWSRCVTFGEAALASGALELAAEGRGGPGAQLCSPFDRGTVVEIGEPGDLPELLGRRVVVRYEIGVSVGDRFLPETELYLMFARLDRLVVSLGDTVELDQPIGTLSAGGRYLVLLASRDATSATLAAATGRASVHRGELWYWDASFLARR